MPQCNFCGTSMDSGRALQGARFCSYICEENTERLAKRETIQKIEERLNTCRVLSEYSGGDNVPYLQTKAAQDLTMLLAEAVLRLLEER